MPSLLSTIGYSRLRSGLLCLLQTSPTSLPAVLTRGDRQVIDGALTVNNNNPEWIVCSSQLNSKLRLVFVAFALQE